MAHGSAPDTHRSIWFHPRGRHRGPKPLRLWSAPAKIFLGSRDVLSLRRASRLSWPVLDTGQRRPQFPLRIVRGDTQMGGPPSITRRVGWLAASSALKADTGWRAPSTSGCQGLRVRRPSLPLRRLLTSGMLCSRLIGSVSETRSPVAPQREPPSKRPIPLQPRRQSAHAGPERGSGELRAPRLPRP